MALTDKLTAIGNAIREKSGTTELMTLDAMATAITNLETGGGGGAEVEPIVLTGDCSYTCRGAMATTYINLFGNTVSTDKLTMATAMFKNSGLTKIPFSLNFDPEHYDYHAIGEMFMGCNKLTELPAMNQIKPYNMSFLLYACKNLREIPEDWVDNWDWSGMHAGEWYSMNTMFASCYSLRKIPENFVKELYTSGASYYQPANNMMAQCYVLDELKDFPVHETVQITGDMFSATCGQNYRLKDFTFATNDDGTPKIAQWAEQYFDLTQDIGYGAWANEYIVGYNSGITPDKMVSDDASYQALKNDPDWYALNRDYSRYNHNSAVNTINSLPDTSAFLASYGGTNTIKFTGAAGSKTDGGAINTLTEEEIAVAAAKGWTVSFV